MKVAGSCWERETHQKERVVLPPFDNNEKSDMLENNSSLVKRNISQNGSLVRKETVESKDERWWPLSKGEKQKVSQ